MRFIKLAIISFVVLFILASCIGLLLPGKVLVSRAIDIQRSTDTILPLVNNLKSWIQWIEGMDQPSVKIINGQAANLNGVEVRLIQSNNKQVITEWKLKSGNMQISTINLIEQPNNITTVQWQFEQSLKWYPWERLGSMMNDKIIGTMMEKNLLNLKKTCEREN